MRSLVLPPEGRKAGQPPPPPEARSNRTPGDLVHHNRRLPPTVSRPPTPPLSRRRTERVNRKTHGSAPCATRPTVLRLRVGCDEFRRRRAPRGSGHSGKRSLRAARRGGRPAGAAALSARSGRQNGCPEANLGV